MVKQNKAYHKVSRSTRKGSQRKFAVEQEVYAIIYMISKQITMTRNKLLLCFMLLLPALVLGQTLTETQMRNARATGYAIVAARNPGKSFSVFVIPWDGVNTLEYNANTQINISWHAQAAVKGNYFNQSFDGTDFSMYSSVALSQTEFDQYKSAGTQWWIVCSTLPAYSCAITSTENGNIGIGTTTPQSKFDVAGATMINGNLVSTILGSTYNHWTYFGGSQGGRIRGSDEGYLVLEGNPTGFGDKSLYLGSSENVLIARGGGNVGIGTTIPAVKLDVKGTQNNTITSINAIAKFLGNDVGIHIGSLAGIPTYGSWIQSMRESDNLSFPISLNPLGGNVGIGTITPAEKLDISGGNIQITNANATLKLNGANVGMITFSSPNGAGTISTYNDNSLRFGAEMNAATSQLVIKDGGNIGIGTTTPAVKLDVNGRGVFGDMLSSRDSYGNTLTVANKSNEATSLFLWQGGVGSGHIGFRPNDNNLYIVNSLSDGAITNPAAIVLTSNGNVGIGTANPAYKLDVLGTIRAQEVLVDMNGVPDYVFAKDYKLRSIEQVSTYVQQNHHLPEIPSAAEMQQNGVSLNTMQLQLLKKVEELTLYAIEQQKEIQALKEEMRQMKK